MSGSPIINARHRLRWHQRLASDASTLLMWGAWLKLWLPVARSVGSLADAAALSRLASSALAAAPAPDVQRYAVALVGTSGTLLLWNRLPSAVKPAAAAARTVADDARHFALDEEELAAGRRTSVCVVHHDELGRVVRVECRPPHPAAAAPPPLPPPHASAPAPARIELAA